MNLKKVLIGSVALVSAGLTFSLMLIRLKQQHLKVQLLCASMVH